MVHKDRNMKNNSQSALVKAMAIPSKNIIGSPRNPVSRSRHPARPGGCRYSSIPASHYEYAGSIRNGKG